MRSCGASQKPNVLIGPYSPNLTALEKASLKAIQDGYVELGLRNFLLVSFTLVRQAMIPHFEEINIKAAEALKLNKDPTPLLALESIFWEGEELTPWGKEFLRWIQEPWDDYVPQLGVDDINDYLLRSVDFYELFDASIEPEGSEVAAPSENPELQSHSMEVAVRGSQVLTEATSHEAFPPSALATQSDLAPKGAFAEVVEDLAQGPKVAQQAPAEAVPTEEGEEINFTEAPLTPFEDKNRLMVRNKYLGYGKNSEGVMGLCGQLTISYFRDRELVGRLESSNPLLFISPQSLSGLSSKVTYWLPPVAFPHPAGHLTIRTPEESKVLTLHSLFPRSRTDFMGDRKVIFFLLLPALVAILYFAFVYFLTVLGIDEEALSLFPETYQAALLGTDTVGFRSGGLGLYQLRIVPAAESLQMIWAAVILVGPLLSSKFFYFLSRARRRQFSGVLAAALLLPTACLLVAWNFQGEVFPLYSHPDFAPLDLRGFLLWSVPMNLAIAVYLFLSVFGVWDKRVKPAELRFFLPFILTLLYLVVMFFVIYGRSWSSG